MKQTNSSDNEESQPLVRTSSINFNIKDIITILAFLASIVAVYVSITEKIVRHEERLNHHEDEYHTLSETVKDFRKTFEDHVRVENQKLSDLEQTFFFIYNQQNQPNQPRPQMPRK